MANSVSNVYVQAFTNNVRFLAQQGVEKLRNWCQVVTDPGISYNFERLGQMTMGTKSARGTSGRAAASPVNDAPWSRRQTLVDTFDAGDLVEWDDPVKMLVDPNTAITQALGKAARRKVDSLICTAATASSRDGAGGAVTFPAGQIIAAGYGSEISFDIVSAIFEKFSKNDIDPDEEKVFVIGPTQLRKIQQLVEYTSSDYVNVKALAENGYSPKWMGFTWVMSNRITGTPGTSADCFAMTKKAIGFHINKEIFGKVAEDPSRSFAWQVYIGMTAGAIRVEDEQLVWFQAKDTVT